MRMANMAQRRIGRAWRAYQKKKRKSRLSIGYPRSASSSKIKQTSSLSNLNTMTANVVYAYELTFPTETSTGSRNTRERKVINLTGIKMCQQFFLRQVVSNERPVLFNWALVTPKKNQNDGFSDVDFYRSVSDKRAVSFLDLSNGLSRHCRAINTDKWNVIFRKRFVLRDTTDGIGTNHRMFEKYVPIKRQIRFDDANAPSDRLFVIQWCAPAIDTSALPGTTTIADYNYDNHMYFREGKS